MMNEWHEILYPISLNYRGHWSEWEAIREIIQNSLDETEDFEIIQDERGTIIRDNGSGLAVKHLLFGVSEKKSEDSRGRFGEGLKIALVVFKRRGFDVTIRSNGLEVKTATHEIEGEQCLKLLYRKINNGIKGTEVIVHGYHGPTFEDRFALKKQPGWSGKTIYGDKAEIFEEEPTRLYVKDIYVQDLENAKFSYNLWDVRLEESRNVADSWSLKWEIGRLWANVDDLDLLVKFMEAIKEKKWEYHNCYFSYEHKHKQKFIEAFHRVFGRNAFLKSSDDWTTEAEWRGGKAIEVPPDFLEGFVKSGIMTDQQFVFLKSHQKRIRVQDWDLNETQLINLTKLRKVASVFGRYKVNAYLLPPEEEAVWIKISNEIAISTEQLLNYRDAFACFHHELTHARYGVRDATHQMIYALSECAADIAYIYNIPGSVKIKLNNAYLKFRQKFQKQAE